MAHAALPDSGNQAASSEDDTHRCHDEASYV